LLPDFKKINALVNFNPSLIPGPLLLLTFEVGAGTGLAQPIFTMLRLNSVLDYGMRKNRFTSINNINQHFHLLYHVCFIGLLFVYGNGRYEIKLLI
jgi:hypothetical protein